MQADMFQLAIIAYLDPLYAVYKSFIIDRNIVYESVVFVFAFCRNDIISYP